MEKKFVTDGKDQLSRWLIKRSPPRQTHDLSSKQLATSEDCYSWRHKKTDQILSASILEAQLAAVEKRKQRTLENRNQKAAKSRNLGIAFAF